MRDSTQTTGAEISSDLSAKQAIPRLLDAHGGRLYAENRPPRDATSKSGGARFVISLPAA